MNTGGRGETEPLSTRGVDDLSEIGGSTRAEEGLGNPRDYDFRLGATCTEYVKIKDATSSPAQVYVSFSDLQKMFDNIVEV